jgi:hypothetical protein
VTVRYAHRHGALGKERKTKQSANNNQTKSTKFISGLDLAGTKKPDQAARGWRRDPVNFRMFNGRHCVTDGADLNWVSAP